MNQKVSVLFENAYAPPSDREKLVRTAFGLPIIETKHVLIDDLEIPFGQITYITGFSGGGKSSLLREIKKQYAEAVDIEDIEVPSSQVIDVFNDTGDAQAIQWLSRFGLGEARVLVTRASALSAGQMARLKLALLLWSKPKIVIIDEFLSYLDRTTARVIAFQFQKIVRESGTRAFLATAHDDLNDALKSNVQIKMDFLGKCDIQECKWDGHTLPEKDEVRIEDGTMEDYHHLKRFHYMDSQTRGSEINDTLVSIKRAVFRGNVVGVRMFSKPYPTDFEKIGVFKLINSKVLISSRVIVHPSFRGLGISSRLGASEMIPSGYSLLCTHSALERFFPFDLSSGFKKVEHPSVEKTPLQDQLEDRLERLGAEMVSQLYDFERAQSFWSSLKGENAAEVFGLIQKILADYDLRLLLYYCRLLGADVEQATPSFQKFFDKYHSRRTIDEGPELLSEAMHFPMQGLARRI